jgi:hypothetical protein
LSAQQERTVRKWEYTKIVLNEALRRGDDIDLLSNAGEDGWELVAILPNNVAYLKREIPPLAGNAEHEERGVSEDGMVELNNTVAATEPTRAFPAEPVREEARVEVKAKYRDPKTNETWSGRGRMATWLKRKQDAGEDIEKYLVLT